MLKYLILKVFEGRTTLKRLNLRRVQGSLSKLLASVCLADKLATCHWTIIETTCLKHELRAPACVRARPQSAVSSPRLLKVRPLLIICCTHLDV